MNEMYTVIREGESNELQHYGVLGMKWGVRRYTNEDGTLNEAGKKKYLYTSGGVTGDFNRKGYNFYKRQSRHALKRSAKRDIKKQVMAELKNKTVSDALKRDAVSDKLDKMIRDAESSKKHFNDPPNRKKMAKAKAYAKANKIRLDSEGHMAGSKTSRKAWERIVDLEDKYSKKVSSNKNNFRNAGVNHRYDYSGNGTFYSNYSSNARGARDYIEKLVRKQQKRALRRG